MAIPDHTTLMKRCTHCGIEKPATTEFFARQKTGKYGFRADCKECHFARQRSYNNERGGKEKRRDRSRVKAEEWREFWAEFPNVRERPYATLTCYRCKRKLPSTTAYFHRDDTNKFGLNRVCKDCIGEYQSEYFKRPEVISHGIEYRNRTDVKDKQRAIANNRRAAPGSFTAADIEGIRKAQGNRCYICHKKLGKKYHIDHFIPLKLGGTHDPGNLRLACPKCNFSKNAKHPHDLGILI